jgi:hypothetical protein
VEIYNWNGDGDSRFGESGDGMDLAAELYVARLPFRTPEQVGDYLKKYFSYAGGQKGDFRGRALVVGAEEFRARQEALTKLLSGLRKDSDYQVDSLIEVPVPKIIETMNKGYAVLDIFGHGCPHHMWLGEKRSHFGVPQIRKLKNKDGYGIVYSQGCSANDYRKWESMGVAFLLQPEGGAVAYTGYTATSFAHPVNQSFYKLIFSGKVPQLARALAEAKDGIRDPWVKEYLNILGEPEMWVWTAKPGTLKVEGDLQAGVPARFRITNAGGEPVARARLLLRGSQYLVGDSDASGTVRLSAPEKPGKMKVTVIAQNFPVVDSTCMVKAAEGPVLLAPEVLVDDDGEGESRGNGKGDLSPDETAEIRLSWREAPPAGTLHLDLEDPFVEVVRGTLPAGKGDGAFVVKVKSDVRPGHRVWVTIRLEVPDQEGSWRWRHSLPIQGPALRCVRVRIDDKKGNRDGRVGWEDAGAELSMYISLFNRGNQDAAGVLMNLSAEAKQVTLVETEVKPGTVKAQEAREARAPFRFSLAPTYDGSPLEFRLDIKDREGNLWKASIRISVPPAPPILLSHVSGTDYVLLSWRPGGTGGVFGHHVYRSTRSGRSYKRLTQKPIRGMTVFRDGTVKSTDDYYYVVTAVTAEGLESPFSKEHHARTLTRLWGRKR